MERKYLSHKLSDTFLVQQWIWLNNIIPQDLHTNAKDKYPQMYEECKLAMLERELPLDSAIDYKKYNSPYDNECEYVGEYVNHEIGDYVEERYYFGRPFEKSSYASVKIWKKLRSSDPEIDNDTLSF